MTKMTLNCLIIKYLKCHLSFVIFAFTLSLQQFASCLWVKICVMERVQDSKSSVWFNAFHTCSKLYILGASFPFGKSRLASQVKCAPHRASP